MVIRRWSRRGASVVVTLALATTGFAVLPGTASAASDPPLPIAAIQGTTRFSPVVGKLVTTTPSQVTAVYATGGLDGFVIQTPGTGGRKRKLTKASDAIFVYTGTPVPNVKPGDLVSVTGTVKEYPFDESPFVDSLTEIGGKVTVTTSTASYEKVKPVSGISWASTAKHRENLESMLFFDSEKFTVTDNFDLASFGAIGLGAGGVLVQPTDVARYGSRKAEAQAARNAARGVVLDDGSSARFNAAGKPGTPPYLTRKRDVKVGDTAKLTEPVIVDFRNNAWTFNPTRSTPAGDEVATLTAKKRESVPRVKGDVSVASFNVLNYFTTLGSKTKGCAPGPVSTDGSANVTYDCDARGAWDAADLDRQQTKIVKAINGLDASVVGLLEIENSVKLGEQPDEALKTLVAALNAAAGRTKWAYVGSRTDQLQPVTDQDAITNALIYQPGEVRFTGKSYADGKDAVDSGPFGNARTPIAASFAPIRGGEPVLVSVNHFKSKGSAPTLPNGKPDQNDANADHGQGAWNVARVAQAKALLGWLPSVTADAGTDSVALVGDFNSYTREDPLRALYGAGYINAAKQKDHSYSFDGLSGSLDHVLLNQAAAKRKTGSGVWNINSIEPVAREYSAYKTTAVNYYVDDRYRSSDHDPVVVGLKAGKAKRTELTLLNFNDFHGRIAEPQPGPDTVKFFGTIEEQRAAAGEDNTLLMSAGDNIGASLFASSVQQDQPTIDVLNAADLEVSSVGNHEFDRGFADLAGRVDRAAGWTYLGANVYKKGTTTPALPAYTVVKRDGLRIGVIGAVTEETPTLVSPAGVKDLDFGNPVDAVNRVAKQLTDGKKSNGEADILVAEYHEGATAGEPPSTLAEQVKASKIFGQIVNDTSPKVAAIFTAHTHMTYAWDGPVGTAGKTRPVMQSGSYAAKVGKVTLSVDTKTKKVLGYTRTNLDPTATSDEDLVATYPRVAKISGIVHDAVAKAAVLGSVKIGEATGPLTRAYTGAAENRGAESTLSNLVAEMYRQSLASPERGAAQIGVQNPGGVRSDLAKGDILFSDAASVLPFANSLFTVDLTGAQFKTLLEQQWQTNPGGTPPTRPYLQLGLSDNVTYTFDAARAEGDRITSIAVDGKPINPTATYRVGTNSFLAAGGDNFRVFAEGANSRDTGLSDLDSWTNWIRANTPVGPSYAKHAVGVSPLPSRLTAGQTTTFALSNLDFTSKGGTDPKTASVTATLGGTAIGTFGVVDGKATVALAVPADATAGATTLVLKAADNETTVTIPVTVG